MNNAFSRWFPVLGRAFLYFWIATLPVFLGFLKEHIDGKTEPTWLEWLWIVFSAVFAGLVALRAYFDTSFKRRIDEVAEKSAPVLVAGLLLTGCATTPERQLLTISNGQVVLVDSAMIGWATYVKTHSVPATDIAKVRTAYRVYHKAALAEKQAWVSYVSTHNLDDVRRAERIVLDLRQPLLDLLLELDASGVAFETAAERATEDRTGEVTLADVEWAFTFLRPYEAYGIPEKPTTH